MNQQEAMLHAACVDPNNMDVRLAYADLLDELGHGERSEFIRVQIELARRKADRLPLEDVCLNPIRQTTWYKATSSGQHVIKPTEPVRYATSTMHVENRATKACEKCEVCLLRDREARLVKHEWFWMMDGLDLWLASRTTEMGRYVNARRSCYGVIRQGFVQEVACDITTWVQRGVSIVLSQPVTAVTLTEHGGAVDIPYAASVSPLQWARKKARLE